MARFYASAAGDEPVRGWLKSLSREDCRIIGTDIQIVEFGWPVGLPVCRSLGNGLWEVRSNISDRRIARIIFGFHGGEIILLHGFIKKTQKAPRKERTSPCIVLQCFAVALESNHEEKQARRRRL